jgi:preprotein translocase subunit SecF
MYSYPFIAKSKTWVFVSLAMVIISLVTIAAKGIQKSVDFAGGTQLIVQFRQGFQDQDLRARIDAIDNKASVNANKATFGSEFTIKIKQPDVERGKEAEASRTRYMELERAFAALTGEEPAMLALLQNIESDQLLRALMLINPFEMVASEQEIQSVYRQTTERIKSSLAGRASLAELCAAAEGDRAMTLESGLQAAFPAINRITAELLDSYLQTFDPLGRGQGSSYADLAQPMVQARQAQNDFLADLDGALAGLTYPEGQSAEAFASFVKSHFRVGDFHIASNETFSPTIAKELFASAFWAVIMALLGILIYIAMRFTLAYAVGAVVALAHDVIIALGVFSLVGAEMSSPVVAAFLTIVGYSLNDTIVVFDRIRETAKGKDLKNFAEIMNRSINETLSRTLITSGTTLLVVVVLFLGANATLRDFALPLLVGIGVGTYSSIFVASPLVLLWHQRIKPVDA